MGFLPDKELTKEQAGYRTRASFALFLGIAIYVIAYMLAEIAKSTDNITISITAILLFACSIILNIMSLMMFSRFFKKIKRNWKRFFRNWIRFF